MGYMFLKTVAKFDINTQSGCAFAVLVSLFQRVASAIFYIRELGPHGVFIISTRHWPLIQLTEVKTLTLPASMTPHMEPQWLHSNSKHRT